jgi:hypothetical protein
MDPTKAIRLAMMVAKGVSSVTDKPLFKKDGGGVDADLKTAKRLGMDTSSIPEIRKAGELSNFHNSLGAQVNERAMEHAQRAQEYHESGKLPMPVGTRFHTEHSRKNDMRPWTVVGHYVDSKDPEKYGYFAERGKPDDEDWSSGVLLASDPKADERFAQKGHPPINRNFQALGSLSVAKADGGEVDVDNPLAMMGRPQRRMASKMAVGPQPLTIDAYHGTPHLFPPSADNPLGEFDSSKIGTGEGNEAYGHGHYLSETPGVAGEYKTNLSKIEMHDNSGKSIPIPENVHWVAKDLAAANGDYNKVRNDLKEHAKNYPWPAQVATKYIDELEAIGAKPKASGSLYTVHVPDEHVEKMLDWDKPLSEQHPHVQRVVKDIMQSKLWDEDTRKWMDQVGNPDIKGGKFYQFLANSDSFESRKPFFKPASEELARRGVFGIKYLDEQSRLKGKGTRNFVVFPGNEKHLKILKREAKGGAVYKAGGGNVKTEDVQKTIRRALMVARSARGTGGANMADEPPLAQIIKRGQPIFPKTPDPTNEELVAARADTRVGSDIVNQRLNKIVPESSRVVGGQYTPGAPGGGRWSDLPRQVLESPGTGFNVQDHELHDLWQQAVNESSQAAKNAVAHHKIVPTFGASGWDKAMRLPIKDRLWYELSGEKMAENMPDLSAKEHMHFMDLVGATSARAEPGENLERALGVLSQSLRGKPVDVDLTQPSAVRQALSRKGQDSSALPGNKTGHFSDTLALAGGVPTRFPISVNDVWVGRMFGVPDDVMSQNQSLHEPMALYFNKIRDLYNQRHGHEAPFVHQSWNFQAPAWVHLRDPDATVSSGDAYHQVWGKIVKKLQDANVPGIEGNKITREALMHPSFADALRRTTPAFRDAPKATIEFGTKLTPKGERARQLYDLSVQNGDTVSQKDYLNTLVGTMYHSARGKLHPWDRLKRAITGDLSQGSDITRIMHPTKDDPLSVGGTFEGDVSPNIRVPLKGMSDDHIAMFNALAGGPLRQAAMATSKIHAAEIGSEPREGHIRGHSIFVPTLDQIHSDDIRSFAKSLTQAGHDMSYVRHPNGYQFDVLPNFSGDVPTGISEDQLNNSYRQTLEAKHPNAKVIAHDFSSIYTPDSEYGNIRSKLIGGIKNDFIRQARLAGMEDREARRLLKQSVSSSDVPEASRRAWLAHRARIDHLTQAEKQLKAFAQQVEANHSAFIDRAEKRMRLAPKETLDQPLSVSEPEKSTGGIVDRALHLVSHLSRR